MDIFNPNGDVLSAQDGQNRVVYISGGSGIGYAILATKMIISEGTDSDIFRSLTGGAYIMTYGRTPVGIQITGVELRGNCTKVGNGVLNKFKIANIAKKARADIKVTVSGAGSGATTYRCALISLNTQITSNHAIQLNLSLVGVRE